MLDTLARAEVVMDPSSPSRVVAHPSWPDLRDAVKRVRSWQSPDGSIDWDTPGAPDPSDVRRALDDVISAVQDLAPLLPHDATYLRALVTDLRRWADEGFSTPDFLRSLLAFEPARNRVDGRQHLVVFPMYTQNGDPDHTLEAMVMRVVWPTWLAEIERTHFDNPLFLPVAFEDFTDGYDTHSAVLFPETVAAQQAPERFSWGAIFCDREAARFMRVVSAAVDATHLALPAEAAALLADERRAQEAFVLWDLIHDRSHSHGDLPFDPFMIKQRQPFWMYALEELRCDLQAFHEAGMLAAGHCPQARDVQYAVLFDRIFRFPLTGSRTRNYDGLAGQILFASLHQRGALRWTDNRLSLDWEAVRETVEQLRQGIIRLYREGIDRPKIVHWLKAHDLVAAHLAPHPASAWAAETRSLDLHRAPRDLLASVLPDEFPLSLFYEALGKKLRPVIESTEGITAATPLLGPA